MIITQKVDENDDILGFFVGWIAEFVKHCEKVTVICLQKGESATADLPENVKVLSLGKEQLSAVSHQPSALQKLKYIFNFYKYILGERKNYDSVFVHMNPEYIILGAPLWKLWRKKIALWYTHKQVDFKLRIAEKLVDKIFSASKESFRLPSRKLKVMGHGINIKQFSISNFQFSNKNENKLEIITVGRIAPVKNLHILIEVADILKNKDFNFIIKVAGAPALESDKVYFEKLKNAVKEKGLGNEVIFVGSIPHGNIPKFYADEDLFVNLSGTGSVDKAVLEAMAAGLLVLTSNEAFRSILPEKYLTENNPEQIAEKITALSKQEKD